MYTFSGYNVWSSASKSLEDYNNIIASTIRQVQIFPDSKLSYVKGSGSLELPRLTAKHMFSCSRQVVAGGVKNI